jgi:hypothetical protein
VGFFNALVAGSVLSGWIHFDTRRKTAQTNPPTWRCWRWQQGFRSTRLVRPEFQPSHIRDLAAEHTHMPVHIRSKDPDANYIAHIYLILLLLRHVRGNVNPDGIHRDALIEILPMQVNCIALRFIANH